MYAPSSKIVDAVIGGWEFAGLAQLQTGVPWNPGCQREHRQHQYHFRRHAVDPAESRLQTILRPAHRTVGTSGQYANPAAFAEPAPGFLGNVSRNMIYGPGVQNYDMSLDKNFAMPYNEHHQLQIRFDAFNALNHTDFANPGVRYQIDRQAGFGQITSTNSSTAPRQLQLAARYTF